MSVEIAVIVNRYTLEGLNWVEAIAISSPTAQSTASATVMVVLPAGQLAASLVQVMDLVFP